MLGFPGKPKRKRPDADATPRPIAVREDDEEDERRPGQRSG